MKNKTSEKMGYGITHAIAFLLKQDNIYEKGNSRQSGYHLGEDRRTVSVSLRLFMVFLIILLTALSRNAIFYGGIMAILLLLTSLMPAESIVRILKNVIPAAILAALIMLPAVFLGNPKSLVMIVIKVAVSLTMISRLNEKVAWKEITASLGRLHFPELLILILDTTVHFLVIMGRISDQILEAVNLRTVSKVRWNNSQSGGILGTTYLIAERHSEETSEAMKCRCFSGHYKTMRKHRVNCYDMLYCLLMGLIVAAFIYSQLTVLAR